MNRKTGYESFHLNRQTLNFTLLEFWQWSSSDLVSNALRGVLAEYIVGKALGNLGDVRKEWDAYDLQTVAGIKVEVKSAAYVQSWPQTRPSTISFNIAPTLGWNAETNEYGLENKRQAEVYVFALLSYPDKTTIDPLNVDQWEFYVLPTAILNHEVPTQKSISLNRLQQLAGPAVQYSDLRAMIDAFISKD